MSEHRTWRITLPASEARCEPADCVRKSSCARWLALIPKSGATLISGHGSSLMSCMHWLDADKHRTKGA